MTVLALEQQPQFPVEDLSDLNAEYLSLMLANRAILLDGHCGAENEYPIFSGTHTSLRLASGNVFYDTNKVQAISFGITAFEAMSYFVKADRLSVDYAALQKNIGNIIKPENAGGVQAYFEESYRDFHEVTPRAAAVIHESAQRYTGLASLSVLGGAIARRFELDNLVDSPG